MKDHPQRIGQGIPIVAEPIRRMDCARQFRQYLALTVRTDDIRLEQCKAGTLH